MKRIDNRYANICSMEQLEQAHRVAQRGKQKQYGVILFKQDEEANLLLIREELISKTYRTSEYKTAIIYEPKERIIYKLPYKDRIVQHSAMIELEEMFVASFTADTYSCIKGRGIHSAKEAVERALKDKAGTQYCLKLDIKKFYPSVDHVILKQLLRRKIKDADMLWLLDGIIDSADGLPIGNYLSQYFANFYLTYFDHWLKEVKKVKYYFRYADDMVFLSDSKPYLHQLLADIRSYLKFHLKLEIKYNYQVFPVAARSIDFVGYRIYHTHTLLRKSIKQNFARAARHPGNRASIASYIGWAKHCNSKNLLNKILPHEKIQRHGNRNYP